MSQKNAARHNLRANPPILPRLPRPPVSIVLQPCTHSRCPKPQESSRVRNLRSLRSKAYGGVVRPTSRLLGDPHLLAQLLADRHARLGLGREPRALVFAHRLHAQHPIGHLAWVLSAVESIESAAPHGRTAASHRSLNVFAARPECVAQPGAWRASPKRPGYSMLWRCQDARGLHDVGDGAQLLGVLLGKECDGAPRASRAAGAANAVDVRDGRLGEVVVDDGVDALEVDAACLAKGRHARESPQPTPDWRPP
eukprot:scaffold90771_cov36-Phaeocystis_antarctica.AAC.1